MDLIEKRNSTKRHPWELARFEVVRDISKSFIKETTSNILDLGSGDLFFIQKLKKLEPTATCYAVDIAFTPEFIKDHKASDIKIHNSIDQLPTGVTFDIIYLMDVLEHIEDDENFLIDLRLRDFVDNNTVFIITVPAYQNLFFSHDTYLKHYRRYTNRTLVNLIEKCNLKEIEKGYFFLSLLAPRYIAVTKERIIGTQRYKNGTDLSNWRGNHIMSQFIKKILIIDYKIQKGFRNIGIKLPGLSNYIVCKKSA